GSGLIESHIVSYVPSASVLAILRSPERSSRPGRVAIAISASPINTSPSQSNSEHAPIGNVTRGVYDLDGTTLAPLPSANDEARSVAASLTGPGTEMLIGAAATESEVKQRPLSDFRVIHFAAHGIVSTKY